MVNEVRRVRYFDGLFLKAEEFNLEQNYHNRMRRLHNRYLHSWGIVWGLEVVHGPGNKEVTVKEGMALNKVLVEGEEVSQEIILAKDTTENLSEILPKEGVYIYISYKEDEADVVPEKGGTEEIHWLERGVIAHSKTKPTKENENIVLAKVVIKEDNTIDASSIFYEEDGNPLRRYAGFSGKVLEAEKLTLAISGITTGLASIEGKKFVALNGIQVNSAMTNFAGPLNVEGNVGIGTSSPEAKLHVSEGDIRLDNAHELFFKDNGQIRSLDNSHRILFRRTDNKMELREFGDIVFSPGAATGAETAKVVLLGNGSVGIGTISPESKLHVSGGDIRLDSARELFFKDNGQIRSLDSTHRILFRRTDNKMELREQGDIIFSPGATTGVETAKTVMLGNGSVGIGTTSPESKLHVSGGDIRLDSARELFFKDNGQIRSLDDNHRILFRRTENKMELREFGDIVFSPGAAAGVETAKAIMLANGKVGIGTTSPGEKLEIVGNLKIAANDTFLDFGADTRQMINLWGNGPNAGYGIGVQAATQYYRSAAHFAWYIGGTHSDVELNSGGGTAAMVIKRGSVGIGTTTPAESLEVTGNIKLSGEIILEDWKTPTFENSWVNYAAGYNPAGYFIDKLGIVHLRGLVKLGVINQSIFTLPAGYRPEFRQLHAVQTNSNTIGRCDIATDGKVIPVAGDNGWFSLDGITFRARKEIGFIPIEFERIIIR